MQQHKHTHTHVSSEPGDTLNVEQILFVLDFVDSVMQIMSFFEVEINFTDYIQVKLQAFKVNEIHRFFQFD